MSKRVIIIDDSKFLIKQIADFFREELGFDVVATGFDGNDAVALFNEHQPDLMTMDITMPNKDGQEALDEILAAFPDARILMISAVRGDAMLECMNRGAAGYVEKPLKFSQDEFREDFTQSVFDSLGNN